MDRSTHFYDDFELVSADDRAYSDCDGCAFQAHPDECMSAPDCVPGPDNKLEQRMIFVRKVVN